jgi:hypothetical protein
MHTPIFLRWCNARCLYHRRGGGPCVRVHLQHGIVSSKNKITICVGYYVNVGTAALQKPVAVGTASKMSPYIVRIEDTKSSKLSRSDHLEALVEQVCPYPKKYSMIWSTITTDTPLYVWQPIPPSADYVALGVVCTTNPDEPDQNSIHCVPSRWVRQISEEPERLWDNSGLGGKKGSFWRFNKHNFFQCLPSHLGYANPKWYTLNKEKFYMSEFMGQTVVAPTPPPTDKGRRGSTDAKA